MNKYSLIILVLIMTLAGCVSTRKVTYDIDIPELDSKGYNDPFFKEGWELLRAGNADLAYQKFRESNSRDYKLYNAFGYVYLMKNKLSNASRNFSESLKLEKDNIQAEYGLAMISELKKEFPEAFRRYSDLLTKYPETAWIRTKYEMIKSRETGKLLRDADESYKENDTASYIRSLEMASEFSPEIWEIKLKIADFYFEQGDYEKASSQYESALDHRPNDSELMEKLAATYEKSENFDSAIVIYKRILKIKPGDISITNRINDLKIKFHEIDLPMKFKNIFFKEDINREELAALIGHYFDEYLYYEGQPVILTDIGGSFAKNQIIQVCSAGIIQGNPDHSFERFKLITRAALATVIRSLLDFLQEKRGVRFVFTPASEDREPADISPLHRQYRNIQSLIRAQILNLDGQSNFNPTLPVTPADVMTAIRKIVKAIQK